MEGAHPGLERLVPGLDGAATAVRAPAESVPAGVAGDDITRFAVAPNAADTASESGDAGTFFFDEADEKSTGIEVAEEYDVADIPAVIFRNYDIRGVVGESLTAAGVLAIGRAIGSEAYERGQQGIVVARDGRSSSPELAEALIAGLRESGRDVIDIGLAPTPVLYFATHYLDTASGVMVTGSHNPAEYNGLKIVLNGEALAGDAIRAIRTRIAKGELTAGTGSLQSAEIVPEYIRRVSEDVPVALGNALKIVVDCGNSVSGIVAPQLLRALGHDVTELYCEVDGSFPNHHPDPSQPENLVDLIDMVKLENADLGLAFDGDGDRLGVVDADGNVIWPDRQMILFARDILSRNPGAKIIFDVKCSRHLAAAIDAAGGEPLMWKTGHSLIKAKMRETGALLAGEMSGHIFFKERWYGFDDALYAAARLTEILVAADRPAKDVFAELPGGIATPELRIDMAEERHAQFMTELIGKASFDDARITTIDGLRIDLPDAWGVVRPSHTTPCLVLRFEGDDQPALERIKTDFRDLIASIDPDLTLPF
ncbi:MAG: phosphomannomutase/phosphoglucomutase [Gammaproteobacteria bacterium]|nr:phosphomannomutase/phosphoglucomutase [Gammaproteobacteria bacterium]